jgi:hypothetical protein
MIKPAALVAGAGALALVAFCAIPSGAAPRTESLGTKRALCTKIGTGELRDLWLTAEGKCQAGYNPTDVKALGIGGGAQGPKGDKGDPGDGGAVWARKTTVHLTAASPATQTVVITGVPAKSDLNLETAAPLTNAASAPGSSTVTVTALAVSKGSTERSYRVEVAGLTEPFDLIVQVWGATA